MDWLERQNALIGENATNALRRSHIIIFGIGGVGSYALEALCRAGVGRFTLVDGDCVSTSNINRQLIADTSTVGIPKAEAAKSRVGLINPSCEVNALNGFADKSNTEQILSNAQADYIIDCIDCVTTKIILAEWAFKSNTPIISSMGTGNKLDPSRFEITDISKTSVCPLARVMRRELKAHGVKKLTVLYSKEEPIKNGSRTPASISFVPSAAGLMIAGHVVRDIIRAV